MQFQFDVGTHAKAPPPPPATPESPVDLLRQILEVQKELLQQARISVAQHDQMARWRALAARWKADYPELPAHCKEVLPALERAYGGLINDMVLDLRDYGEEGFASEFALQEFLDRFGMRLGQLGHLLSLVGPLAEATPPPEQTQ